MTTGKLKVLSAAALIAVAGAVQAAVSQPRHVTIEYEYAKDGEIVSRKINGAVQRYEYDLRGQLTGVYDVNGKAVESYNYDAAGNILKKTVDGKTTTFKYDAANQLVSKEDAAGLVAYEYDAAGRMVREGDKQYKYSYLDKITSVLENGQTAATMDYFVGGQLASVTRGLDAENFIWDGLALVHRDGSDYLNEPSIGGGNPVASNGKVMLNDMLGNTVAVKNDEAYCTTSMTAFGESSDSGAFFTGKPFVGELGYAFLMRSYRPENGKWQTADPLGYPDGWNQLAYCNNHATSSVDLWGCSGWEIVSDTGIPADIPDEAPVFMKDGYTNLLFYTKWYYSISYSWEIIYSDSFPNPTDSPSIVTIANHIANEEKMTTEQTTEYQSSLGASYEGITAGLSEKSSIRYENQQTSASDVNVSQELTIDAHTKLDYYKYQLIATVTVTKYVANLAQTEWTSHTVVGAYNFPLYSFNTRMVYWKELVE